MALAVWPDSSNATAGVWSTSSTDTVIYTASWVANSGGTIAVLDNPKRERTPLEWLDERVNEIRVPL